MSTEAVIALIEFFTLIGAVISVYASLVQRITRLETFFEVMGKKAAQVLHSPHTPDLDAMLEKYMANRMVDSDWFKLLEMVEEIERDDSKAKSERILAAHISTHCRKRLGLKVPEFKPHKETTTQ